MPEFFDGVLSWATDLEPEARQQAINTASLPFVMKPLALMPDAHFGMGATIGSVVATEGAVVPSCVGVDIGCFVGDTKVPLLNGRQSTLRDLTDAGEVVWVYALDDNENIVPAAATALKTRTDAELLRVVVSGGEEIVCTPDHEFMLRDGTYRRADKLSFNDSLMPLYRTWQARDGSVIEPSNHKVIAIEAVDYREDVYCLQVPEYHNFALAAGVFVHNCGMIAARFNMTASDLPDDLSALHSRIAASIPAGVGKGFDFGGTLPEYSGDTMDNKMKSTAGKQLGSLGSGNHFVEVCLDENDDVWAVLHSGSRGVGNKLAQAHIKVAKGMMKQMFISLPDPDLAYLSQGTPEFSSYIYDMLWAQDYALANRDAMMRAVVKAVRREFPSLLVSERINCHHNFTQPEAHHGRDVWLTRKGAIKAGLDDRGVIPGSMGTKSYIVTGLGNEASYSSCSHGAGRRMSRTKARATISIESLNEAMAGKTWNSTQAMTLLDEAPASYKDIDQVMANQADLVRVDHTLHQVLNYKGT